MGKKKAAAAVAAPAFGVGSGVEFHPSPFTEARPPMLAGVPLLGVITAVHSREYVDMEFVDASGARHLVESIRVVYPGEVHPAGAYCTPDENADPEPELAEIPAAEVDELMSDSQPAGDPLAFDAAD